MHKVCYLDHNWLSFKLNNDNVKKHLNDITGVVYDLGCGIRPYEKDILAAADKYIGVDWNKSFHGMHADIEADLNQPLPIENNVADVVISFQVLEHLCEPQAMITEAFRILKPEGLIFISVPFQWWIHEAPHDYYRFTCYGLKYLFTKAGFVDIAVKETSGFWTMWLLKLNYQTCKLIRGPKAVRWMVRTFLWPLWMINQIIAPVIDLIWSAPQETAGYTVTARKPAGA